MKTLSAGLAAHLAEECSTLAYLVKITRADGVVRAYTNHDRDLAVGGVTYQADGAFNPSALVSSAQLSTDNLSVSGMISDHAMTAEDLAAGRYDHARCDVYVCNWADLTQGVLQLRRGWIGEVSLQDGRYVAALHGLHALLQQEIGEFYTGGCRHRLGDAGCGVALGAYTVTGQVTAVVDAARFQDSALGSADGVLDYGTLTWMSGANAGLTMEVKRWAAGAREFTLWLPMPRAIGAGDAYSVHSGCDKRAATCRGRFNNLVNFGGFPHMPGVDRMLQYPDSKA